MADPSTDPAAEQTTKQEGSRRSNRIASQPKKEESKPARSRSKKRTAETAEGKNDGEDVPAAKKTKGDDGEAPAAGSSEDADTLASIDIGDSIPSLTLKNEKDEDVEVASLTADKGLILFLVPKADTPGCTNQACGFRDSYPDFESLNFNVYCLSADTPAAQSKWQGKNNLPYPLLSDRKRVLITALGAGEGGKTKRSHFIFEQGGKLVDKKNPVKPADSPKLALEFVKSLSSSE